MANPNITKLPAIPWPTLAGASLLLHAGVLSVGLPRILPVSNPTDAVNIPVTLVDDEVIPVAATPPEAQPTPPSSAPQPKPAQVTPTDGQTITSPPTERREVKPQAPAPSQTPQKPSPPPPQEAAQPTPPPAETETVNDQTSPGTEIPMQQPPTDNPSDTDGVAEAIDAPSDNADKSSSGPTQVSIVDDVQLPKNSGSDQIDQYPIPSFQMPITFDIPANHTCQGTLSNDVINLGVFVDADGLVSSLRFLDPDIYGQNPDLNLADCLWSTALIDSNALRFSPAIRLSNIGEEEAVPTDRVELRLRFSGG